ncbi:MAG TPA: hypothetical protein VGJ05_05990 [Fimbriiglobus sp.]|jgi:hypothetical protein
MNATTSTKDQNGELEEDDDTVDPLELAIRRIKNRSEAEMLVDRAAILASCQPPRPLPEGKTLNDVIEGTWPGDETDEEIYQMLEDLS